MTCMIERILTPDGLVVLRVSGHIDAAHVEALLELTEKEKITKGGVAIDSFRIPPGPASPIARCREQPFVGQDTGRRRLRLSGLLAR